MEPEFVSHKEMFEGIIQDIEEWLVDAHKNRLDLKKLENEINSKYERGEVSDVWHSVEMERCKRAQEKADYCVKSLEHQKKLAIMQLKNLND